LIIFQSLVTFYYKISNTIAIPVVTASAWAIHDAKTGDLLWEKKADDQKEMASLTKMMTCLLCYHLLQKYGESPDVLIFSVNRIAAMINGTHSGLKEGDQVSILDLFYGLMLPSGNDCALTLAYGFGNLIVKRKKKKVIDGAPISPLKEFIREMNKLSIKLGLKNTQFVNPHGLSEKGNKSTAADLGKLASIAIQVPLIEKIVSTKNYSTFVIDNRGSQRKMEWNNTNKLLDKGFAGIKTGVTPNAGPCLSSLLRNEHGGVIVTLLNCKTLDHRWSEAEKLAQWALGNISSVKEKLESLPSSIITPTKINTRIIAGLCKQI
jgi:D-alanyl-D-alanine carboxypeptidase (penicillin-binding protein 5/6)